MSQPVRLNIVFCSLDGVLYLHSVQEVRIAHHSVLGIKTLLRHITTLNQRHNRKPELLSKRIIPAVMRRHSHDGTGSITCKHIFGYPNRHLLSGKWIYSISPGKYSGNGLGLRNPLSLRFLLDRRHVRSHFLFAVLRCQLLHKLAFRSQHHECHAEYGIGARRKDSDWKMLVPAHSIKDHFSSFRAAYPVALHLFQRIRPVKSLN